MSETDPPLATGYGPATAPGDNLLNDFQQETALSYLELARVRGDRRDDSHAALALTDASTPLPFWNRALLRAPIFDAEPAASTIRAFYAAQGEGPYLLDSAWPTPDFRPFGCVLMGHPPLMVRAPDAGLPAAPPELRIIEVNDASDARDAEAFERTLVDGYPAPQFQPFAGVRLFTRATFDANGWHHFLGFVDDRPVAVGSAYVGAQLVRVENIATLDDVRGRGYGAAITAATIAADLSKPAVLVASDLGRPVYEKLGFHAFARVTYWLGAR